MAQDELALLDKVLMRLASADSDENLTAAVNKFLPPCLLKLSSQQEGVRKKVMELLVHINKRIKNNPNIILPLDALLVQYQDPAATSFVTNFTIIYIKMGFPRLPVEKQAELIPAILSSLEGKPSSHQDSLLCLIVPVLGSIPVPRDPEKRKAFLGLNEKPQIGQILSSYLLNLLLLPYGSHPSLMPRADQEDLEASALRLHPGMSEAVWRRVAGETPYKADDLERMKVNVVKFLGHGFLEAVEVAIHLVVAAADSRHSVVSQAETEMRKFSGAIDWNDPGLVTKLYSLFLGSLVYKDKPVPKPEHKRTPSNTRIRLKLMGFLLRSREAASQFPACIQVVFDVLFGTAGNSNAKLRTMVVAFIHHVILHCPNQKLSGIGTILLSALTRIVKEEKADAKLRSSCYVAIGKLGHKLPQLVNRDITMIQTFFEAMANEDKETQLSVQESMSLMATSFREMEKSNLHFLQALLATYVENPEPQVRLVAIQYAGEIFPLTDEPSRYTLLLGAGDVKADLARKARAHLYKAINKNRPRQDSRLRASDNVEVRPDDILPDFLSMLKYVMDKAATRIKTEAKYQMGDRVLAFSPIVYVEVINFLRICLINSSGILPISDNSDEATFGAPLVANYLKNIMTDDSSLIIRYVEFIEKLVSVTIGLPQVTAFLQIVACTRSTTAARFFGKVSWLKAMLDDTKEENRIVVAQLVAIVSSQMSDSAFEKTMSELTRSFKDKSLELQHGVVVALGHSIGRRLLLSCEDTKSFGALRSHVDVIVAHLEHNQALLQGAACLAISELGRCGPLPLFTADEKGDVVKKLFTLLKASKKGVRLREKAAVALGKLCVGEPGFPHRKAVLQEILDYAQEIKDVELHFTLGEALVYATIGPLSTEARDIWSVTEDEFEPAVPRDSSDELIEWVITQLCGNMAHSSHPNVRQATCLWLLALAKQAQMIDAFRRRLVEVQSIFMSFLGDNNDLVQDAASKGLGLVYDASSEAQQKEMVTSLLQTLSEGNRDVRKVTEDTKVFEAGQMGKVAGENLSTYKEICSLATDLNQPDLVYKFMHLANYNAMWNSRKGAAFGFSSIAAKAGKQMEPLLPKIVPKLYRYQFDPTPKIQQSMTSIWEALVADTATTIDKFLPLILEEIICHLTSNQWRVRESCCVALQDLLRGRSLDQACIKRLPVLWKDIFRVMDDIKESVRIAAKQAAGSLSRASIKLCDDNQGANAIRTAVQAIIPPLLEYGLQSSLWEVKEITINTIVKMTKNTGAQLKPHLPILIPALLEAISNMESQRFDRDLSVRMANDPTVQEKLDLACISSAKSSPMMDCINYVLQYLDPELLAQLVPRLIDLIKGNVGIGAKGATAHLVTNLSHTCPGDLQQHAGKLLAAFVTGLADRNVAVRKTYAAAIGHLMKAAKDSSMEKLFVKLRSWYLEKDDLASRHAVAYTFYAILRHNPDQIKRHLAQAVPTMFLAMHERPSEDDEATGEEVSRIWEEVWNEVTPGTEGGIRLYLKEILALLDVAMESQRWKLKAQAALAMGKVAEKLGESLPEKERISLMSTLLNGLAGRTWEGKEAILTALTDVCTCGKAGTLAILSAESKQAVTNELLTTALLRECKREKIEYRIIALTCTGKMIRELDLLCFEELFSLTYPYIKEHDREKDDADDEEEEFKDDDKTMFDLRYAIYECIGLSWPKDVGIQEKYILKLLAALRYRIQTANRKNQLAIAKCLNEVMASLKIPETSERINLFEELAKLLSTILVVPKSTQLRQEALLVLGKAIRLLVECQSPELVTAFKDEIAKSLDDVVRDVSSDVATKATARDLRASLHSLPAAENKDEN